MRQAKGSKPPKPKKQQGFSFCKNSWTKNNESKDN
jgi:hypothetical protein